MNKNNGRINIMGPNTGDIFTLYHKKPINSKSTPYKNALMGNQHESVLSQAFFSAENISIIQNAIKAGVYHLSKGNDIYLNDDCGIDDPLSSVWYVPHNITKKEGRIHPTQMPEKLVERILKVASKKGDVVLDNFMGSGTTGVVSKRFGLDFVGIELNEDYYKMAKKRIDDTITWDKFS